MKTLTRNWWVMFLSLFMMAIVVSCGDDDDPAPNPDPDPDPEVMEPTASFTSSVDELTVTFTNTSENGVSYAWDFGDSNSSTEESPTHTYEEGGEYTVSLTVTGEEGSTPASTSSTVTVEAPDPCEGFDGSQPGNLIVGGGFELCDAESWTVLHSGQRDQAGEFAHAKYEFGYTDYNPADGTDGALYIHPDNDASAFEEGTILYQELSLETGLYNISGLVKAAGENQDDPTSAMNSYWFEIVVNQAVPEEGDGYNNQRATGWIYGGWTGWNVELPELDGPIPHDHMDNNLADADGNFNVTEAGTHYVVIKFGKGDDAAGASFGDGIALDNLHLERIGDVDPCALYDGTQEGNIITGGQFEVCDEQYWTVLGANLEAFPVEFGDTDYTPSTGEGGALYFNNPEETKLASGVGTAGTIYQYVGELEAGTYQLSAQIKQGGVDGGNHQFWWEMYLWGEEPVEGQEYQPKESDAEDALKVRPIAGYTHPGWGPRPDLGVGTATVAVDGEMQYAYNPYDLADSEGQFTVAEAGHYFFVFKFGTWEGSFGEGISIDNLSLTKID